MLCALTAGSKVASVGAETFSSGTMFHCEMALRVEKFFVVVSRCPQNSIEVYWCCSHLMVGFSFDLFYLCHQWQVSHVRYDRTWRGAFLSSELSSLILVAFLSHLISFGIFMLCSEPLFSARVPAVSYIFSFFFVYICILLITTFSFSQFPSTAYYVPYSCEHEHILK